MKILVLLPCHNDAETALELCAEIAGVLRARGDAAAFLLVDDASLPPLSPADGEGVRVLRLRRNLGHQRAIACGLCQLSEEKTDADVVVIMDSDGEDRPGDVPALLDALARMKEPGVAFAQRARRTEGLRFRAGYGAYLFLHRLLVGQAPRVGNFSALSAALLGGLVTDGDLWSHYAATIWKSGTPRTLVPLPRGVRRRGHSKLGYGGLLLHGLAAITCYRETLAARMLLGAATMLMLAAGAGLAALVMASGGAGFLWIALVSIAVLLFANLALLAFVQCFLVLQGRNQATFLPARDYKWFVESHD